MAPHSSALAWKIPWMEEPSRLQSMGSQRVGHDWAISLSLFTFMHGRGNGNPLQCSGLENPRDGRAWWAAVYQVAQSWTRLKWLSSLAGDSSVPPGLQITAAGNQKSMERLFSLLNAMKLKDSFNFNQHYQQRLGASPLLTLQIWRCRGQGPLLCLALWSLWITFTFTVLSGLGMERECGCCPS